MPLSTCVFLLLALTASAQAPARETAFVYTVHADLEIGYSQAFYPPSVDTLYLRADRANANARTVAAYLRAHPRITAVHYLGALPDGDPRAAVFARQCSAPGSTFAFDIEGGEAEAFAFLDRLQVMKLAVSLGGTETLISHPASTTHSGVPRDLRLEIGLTDALIRISVGIEHPDDLIADLEQALAG